MSVTTSPPPIGLVRSRGARVRRLAQVDWIGGAAAVVLVLIVLLAIFGRTLAPHDPAAQDLLTRLTPPAWAHDGSWSHPFGTDELGRDVLSRIMAGTRIDLWVGVGTALLEAVIGITLGLIAGYRGGRVDTLIMRWCDIQMGFPAALIVVFILLLFGSTPTTLILGLGLNGWMIFNRLVRSEVIRIKQEEFVQAAVVSGASTLTIVRHHVLPHIAGRATAIFMLEVPRVILAAATLSFIGLGVRAPEISWGLMIGDSRDLISVAYWTGLLPGLAIVLTVATMYLFASWLEPRLDPLQRGRALRKGVLE